MVLCRHLTEMKSLFSRSDAILSVLIGLFCGVAVFSQTIVRQGTVEDLAPPEYATTYTSPMVLEYTLSKMRFIPIKKNRSQFLETEEFREFDCENVVLE